MNTLPAVTEPLDDYRSTMQSAAEQFLRKHWNEHLDDGQLFERTCNYLVNGCNVPAFMADRLVYLALTKLVPAPVWDGVDMSNRSDETVFSWRDPRDGILRLVSLPKPLLTKTNQ